MAMQHLPVKTCCIRRMLYLTKLNFTEICNMKVNQIVNTSDRSSLKSDVLATLALLFFGILSSANAQDKKSNDLAYTPIPMGVIPKPDDRLTGNVQIEAAQEALIAKMVSTIRRLQNVDAEFMSIDSENKALTTQFTSNTGTIDKQSSLAVIRALGIMVHHEKRLIAQNEELNKFKKVLGSCLDGVRCFPVLKHLDPLYVKHANAMEEKLDHYKRASAQFRVALSSAQ